jgi:hypothetical protein
VLLSSDLLRTSSALCMQLILFGELWKRLPIRLPRWNFASVPAMSDIVTIIIMSRIL